MTFDDVLNYWFVDVANPQPRPDVWFESASQYDDFIRDEFSAVLEDAHFDKLGDWKQTPRGRLALIILLDQFTRQAFRGTARMYENDAKALALAKDALARGDDQTLHPLEQLFLLMPLEHSESLEDQEESVRRFEELRARVPEDLRAIVDGFVDYARRHREIIRRFGRFPHRNDPLQRISTPQEREFLLQPGSSFG